MISFAEPRRQNLDLATPLLGAIAHPIEVDKEVVSGTPPSLDAFAISVAATVTLMFVTVLLVAGSLALEREENAFPRLTRGLVAHGALLGEKVGWAWSLSIVVTLLMLAGLSLFVHIDWGRFPLIVRGDRRRRRRLRRIRCCDRRCGARGPGQLAARVHDLAADRLRLPGRVRHRRAPACST